MIMMVMMVMHPILGILEQWVLFNLGMSWMGEIWRFHPLFGGSMEVEKCECETYEMIQKED